MMTLPNFLQKLVLRKQVKVVRDNCDTRGELLVSRHVSGNAVIFLAKFKRGSLFSLSFRML